MNEQRPSSKDARDRVERHVRRRVGLKVLGDLSRWADGVEREQRERPKVVLGLLVLVLVITVVLAMVVL